MPYSEVGQHDPDNLVLLCPQHHAEKTKGLLTTDQVEHANLDPHNRRTGESHPFGLHYEGSFCEARIGSNQHVWPDLTNGSHDPALDR
jgi:hypothetical protein